MSLKAREDVEGRLAEMENENIVLRAQVAQSQIAMKSTLEEAIKLLQQGEIVHGFISMKMGGNLTRGIA